MIRNSVVALAATLMTVTAFSGTVAVMAAQQASSQAGIA